MSSDESAASKRAALCRVVVRQWAAAYWADGDLDAFEEVGFPLGGAITAPGDGETWAWLYPASNPSSLGGPLIWADRYDVGSLFVLLNADSNGAAATLARQAEWFARPTVEVHQLELGGATGTADGKPAGPSAVGLEPAPFPKLREPEPEEDLIDLLLDVGAEVVVEGGLVRGEIAGLEVARIVHGETSAGVPIDEALLEVGVGAADRELTAMVHGELSPEAQLRRVVDFVRQHRQPDASHHPLNQLVPERWLRAALVRHPGAIDLKELRPAEGPRPRPNLRDAGIALARGETTDGRPVIVACSVGVNVGLVPDAADARAFLDPNAELWLVVPEKDDHPVTRRLAENLHDPARVVAVPDSWRHLG